MRTFLIVRGIMRTFLIVLLTIGVLCSGIGLALGVWQHRPWFVGLNVCSLAVNAFFLGVWAATK